MFPSLTLCLVLTTSAAFAAPGDEQVIKDVVTKWVDQLKSAEGMEVVLRSEQRVYSIDADGGNEVELKEKRSFMLCRSRMGADRYYLEEWFNADGLADLTNDEIMASPADMTLAFIGGEVLEKHRYPAVEDSQEDHWRTWRYPADRPGGVSDYQFCQPRQRVCHDALIMNTWIGESKFARETMAAFVLSPREQVSLVEGAKNEIALKFTTSGNDDSLPDWYHIYRFHKDSGHLSSLQSAQFTISRKTDQPIKMVRDIEFTIHLLNAPPAIEPLPEARQQKGDTAESASTPAGDAKSDH